MSNIVLTPSRGPIFAHAPTITDIFDYAKSPNSGSPEFPLTPTVFATYVDHAPNAHPDPDETNVTNLVRYATDALKLSPDKKTLSVQTRLWRNIAGGVGDVEFPAPPPDMFDDPIAARAITITLADTGQVTYQLHDLKSGAVTVLNATYDNSMFVETSATGMRSLSFTFGYLPA